MLKFKHKSHKVTKRDFKIDNTKVYFADFFAAEAVTMVYSGSNQGKTWLSLALCHEALKNNPDIDELLYFDWDNGRRDIKTRNLEPYLSEFPNWEYYIEANMDMTKGELINSLESDCHNMKYKNKILVIDSTRDLIDTQNDRIAKHFMSVMKQIRNNRGTVLILHHTTKNGKVIEGSGEFERSVDNLFHLEQKLRTDNILQLILHKIKSRDDFKTIGFKVDTSRLSIEPIDKELAMMSIYEEEFTSKAKKLIEKSPDGINQKELLEGMGFEKTDKTARAVLEKFTNKFWKKEQLSRGRPIVYSSLQPQKPLKIGA